MTLFRVADSEALYLATKYPESGMGYQIFDATWSRIEARFFLALNGEFVIPFSSRTELRIELGRLGSLGLEEIQQHASLISFDAEPQLAAQQLGWRLATSLLDPSIQTDPALRAIITTQEVVGVRLVDEPRLYVRYSAFPNDRRVLSDGRFVPGTYATTFNDASMTPSGFAAVGRYALPISIAAQFLFPIVTDASPIYIGTATPNYGQAGGGVEVLFPAGASPLPGRAHRIPID